MNSVTDFARSPKNSKRCLSILLVLVLGALLYSGQRLEAEDLRVVPSFTVKNADGSDYSSESHKSFPRIIFFFFSFAEAQPALPVLAEMAQQHQDQVWVMGIFSDFVAPDPAQMQNQGIPLFWDEDQKALESFERDAQATPLTFIANARGEVVATLRGISQQYPETVSNYLHLAISEETDLEVEPETEKKIKAGPLLQPVKGVEVATTPVEKSSTPPETQTPQTLVVAQPPQTIEKTLLEAINPPKVATATKPAAMTPVSSVMDPTTASLPAVLGTTAARWPWAKSTENVFFFFLIDTWFKLLPLCIWGWGILYCLSKITRYWGMLCGSMGCLGFFLLSLYRLLLQIPDALYLLYTPLLAWKAELTQYYLLGQGWHAENLLILFFQCLVVIALAGRFKKE